jgi:hypothetical protein
MSTASISYAFRPVKIGWLVESTSMAQVRRAMRLSTMLWGGRFNPIVPLDDPPVAKRIVSRFGIDVLFPIAEDDVAAPLVREYDWLRWPPMLGGVLGGEQIGPAAATFLDVSRAMVACHTTVPSEILSRTFDSTQVIWKPNDPLDAVFAAMFGAYDDPIHGESYASLFRELISKETAQLSVESPVPGDLWKLLNPIKLTTTELEVDRRGWAPEKPGIFVGEASNSQDVISFWNLRAAGKPLLFFDPSYSDRLELLLNSYVEAIANQGGESSSAFGIPIWSRDESVSVPACLQKRTTTYCSAILEFGHGSEMPSPAVRFQHQWALAIVDELDGRPSLTFEAVFPFAVERGFGFQRVILSIQRPHLNLTSEEATFAVPYVPRLNEYLSRNLVMSLDKVRVESDGFGILMPVYQTHVTIRALSTYALIRNVFKECGIRTNRSRPGLIAGRLIRQLGGVQGCRVFKIEGVRDLIERYKPTQAFSRDEALRVIAKSFSRFDDLRITSRSRKRLTPRDALDYLVERGVLRVGAELNCPSCQLSFWTSLDDLKTRVRCDFCGQLFDSTSQLHGKAFWKFRRSGLFGSDNHQEGSIPVVVALQHLELTADAIDAWQVHSTGQTLSWTDSEAVDCEFDFILLTRSREGMPQIALGECKTRTEIDETDVANSRRVGGLLAKRGIDPFFVFAKTSPFTDQEIARCRPAADEDWPYRTILLGQRELEELNHVWALERHFDIQRISRGLDQLAEVTHHTYFDPRPRPAASGSAKR